MKTLIIYLKKLDIFLNYYNIIIVYLIFYKNFKKLMLLKINNLKYNFKYELL